MELITGATGFIGLALARRLSASGLKVRCLVRPGTGAQALGLPGVELCRGDLLDNASLEAAVKGVDRVWHLAALVRPEGRLVGRKDLLRRFRETNALATGRLAEAAAEAGVKRLVYFSSIAALGPGESLPDNAPPRPLTMYGRSKMLGEAELKRTAAKTGLRYVIIRPAMIYGRGAKGWGQLFRAARGAFTAVPGRADNEYSVCHVENLLDAALLAAEKGADGSAFNISEGSLPLRELILAAAALQGKHPFLLPLRPGFLRAASARLDALLRLAGLYMPGFAGADRERLEEACARWSHCSEGVRALGWKPAVGFGQGLKETMEGALDNA